MKAHTLTYVLLFSMLASAVAFAQQVPRFNIEATSKDVLALTNKDIDPFQGCMRDEADAERKLRGLWSSTAAAQRQTCTAQAQLDWAPSYVVILACLEMYPAAGSTPPQR
jgi:hypothetical protein